MIALALAALVVTALCWVTFSPRDAWPFSHYPMFARYWADPVVRFYRLRFVLADGSTRPLPSTAGRLADEFHRRFGAVWQGAANDDPRPAAVVENYRRLATRSNPELEQASRIEVLICQAQLGPNRGVKTAEQIVFVHDPSAQRIGSG